MSAYPSITLQPLRRSMDLSAGYVEFPRDPKSDARHPPSRWPKFIHTLPAKIYRRASQAAHIAIVKALLTPLVSAICFTFGHFLYRVCSSTDSVYRAPLYTSALAGLVGGQCMLGWVIILVALFEGKPSDDKWYKYITLPAAVVIFGASAVAGPVGVMILHANSKSQPNPDVLDTSHAFSAIGLGAAIFFLVLLSTMAMTYIKHRSRNWLKAHNGTTDCSNCQYDCGCCTDWCDCGACCSGCDCNCDCGGC